MRRALFPRQGPVVLDEAFQRLPGEVQSVEARIFLLKLGDNAQRLGVVIEAPLARHTGIERALAGMAEGRMAEIVRERERLCQVLIKRKHPRHGAGDLRHFEAVGEACAVMIALVIDEDLRLVGQPPERGRMQDAIPVAAIQGAGG